MDAERETKTITTPSGVEVVLVAELLGGDIMALERAPLTGGKIVSDGKTGGMEAGIGEMYDARHKALVERVIVSVAGKTESSEKLAALKNLKAKDYLAVMKEVDAVANDAVSEKKS